ncbi:MAG: hypothetical protein ACOY2B_13555 [Pseudomonadota bacterium]
MLQMPDIISNAEIGYATSAGYARKLVAPCSITANYLYYDLGSDTLNVAVVPGGGGAGAGYKY